MRCARWVAAGLVLCCATACGEPEAAPAAADSVQVGAENVVTVASDRIVTGPVVSGELTPARQATVRAEVGGSVTGVAAEEGQHVRRGQLLARIESRTLENARQSAASAVRSAQAQLDVAEKESARTRELVAAGALAQRDLETAESAVTAARAQLADARTRLASAEKQVSDAVIRAPIAGTVAERAVNAGDVVSIGANLFTIIDPSSMQLEASVATTDIGALRAGAPVEFDVRGYDRTFEGSIERIAPRADPVTRQIPIYVQIPNTDGTLLAGLFAEGRIVTGAAQGLIVPADAVNTRGDQPWVLKVAGGEAERVPVQLGLRDPDTGRVEITGGVAAGDRLLRGPAQGIAPGTQVDLSSDQTPQA